MSHIRVLSRVPARIAPKREVRLLYRTGGAKFDRQIRVGTPTHMDEFVVTQRRLERQWPVTHAFAGRSIRQLAKSSLRAAHRSIKSRRAPEEFQGPILDLRMIQPNNVAHILLRLAPYCLYAQKIAGAGVTCLFQRTREPFRTLATRLGVTPVFVEGPVSGDFLHILGTRGLAVYELPTVFDTEAMDYFPDTYADFRPMVPPPIETDRLFVARRGPRALINHKTVEAFLTARGYTTVYFEDFSIDQQCALGAAAKDVVAIHGAAMGFFVLGRLNSMVELLPPHVYHQVFAVALPQSIPNFTVVMPDFDPVLAYQPWSELVKLKNVAFETDMTLLEEAVARR